MQKHLLSGRMLAKNKEDPICLVFFWLFGCGFVCVCVLFFFSVSFFKEKDVNTFKVKLSFHIC